MDILAVNRAKGIPEKVARMNRYGLDRSLSGCLIFLFVSVYAIVVNNYGVAFIFFAAAMLCFLFVALYYDNQLRWNRAVETVYVKNEILVIECSGCFFKRKKEIPLSTIHEVERCNVRNLWLWADNPDTLFVVYENARRYRFGICMEAAERDLLAKKIMDIVKCYYF